MDKIERLCPIHDMDRYRVVRRVTTEEIRAVKAVDVVRSITRDAVYQLLTECIHSDSMQITITKIRKPEYIEIEAIIDIINQ